MTDHWPTCIIQWCAFPSEYRTYGRSEVADALGRWLAQVIVAQAVKSESVAGAPFTHQRKILGFGAEREASSSTAVSFEYSSAKPLGNAGMPPGQT